MSIVNKRTNNYTLRLFTILLTAILLIVVFTGVPKLLNSESQSVTPSVTTGSSEAEGRTYHFRNEELLNEHYEKHGIEMGFSSAKEYEAAASAVVNNDAALHKLEQEDGDDVYYLENTNEFVIVSTDGYIRTYFYPDDGKSYYDGQ